MIHFLDINDFKCLHDIHMELSKLNIITGKNSSGKSSVIQAIGIMSDNKDIPNDAQVTFRNLDNSVRPFYEMCNLNAGVQSFSLSLDMDESHHIKMDFTPKDERRIATPVSKTETKLLDDHSEFPEVFHLPANRQSNEDSYKISNGSPNPLGKHGEFVIDYYYNHRSDEVDPCLRISKDSSSLEAQVNGWLRKLTDYRMTVSQPSDSYNVFFTDNLGNKMRPSQVGTGVGYIAALLIVCLASPQESLIQIENPEIHLHPSAQSDLTEFFAIISHSGRQLLIETHSDHIINGILVQLKEAAFHLEDVRIFYFDNDDEAEEDEIPNCYIPRSLEITPYGKIKHAPKGFFDQIEIDFRKLME